MSRPITVFASFLAVASFFAFMTAREPSLTPKKSPAVAEAHGISEALAVRDLDYAVGGSSGLPPDVEGQIMTRIERNGRFYNQVLSKRYFSPRFSVIDRSYLHITYALELTAQNDAPGSLMLANQLQSQVGIGLFIYDMVEDELVDGMVRRKVNLSKIVSKEVYRDLFALNANRLNLAKLIPSLEKRVPQEIVSNLEKQPTITNLQNALRPRVDGSLVSAQNAKEQLDLGLTVYDSVKDKEKLFALISAEDRATIKELARRRQELTSEIEALKKAVK